MSNFTRQTKRSSIGKRAMFKCFDLSVWTCVAQPGGWGGGGVSVVK